MNPDKTGSPALPAPAERQALSAGGRFIFLGSLSACLAVALGAFGKHALMPYLSQAAMETWRTGAYYHLAHGAGLVLAGLVAERAPHPQRAVRAGWLLLAGSVLFSGSLYAIALTGMRILGVITPVGGACFMAGWLLLAWSVKPPRV
ncbi:MAG: DUF423 domain-containing protein [Magnetococcales bacterium]|nr:DUF423 domain-containing protein [Magnetococcales bacterium]